MSSKPFSVRTQPWASFDKQSYAIISDDFVHEKLLTVKVGLKSAKGTINLKNQLVQKGDAFKSTGEIKLYFPVWNSRNGQLYFRTRNDDYKVHYDDGLKGTTLGQFSHYNLYASFQGQRNLKHSVAKLGANLISSNYSVDSRVRLGLADSGDLDVSTGHKFTWAKNGWSVDAFQLFGWRNKSLLHNALRVGYRKDSNDFFLRAENSHSRSLKTFNFGHLDTYFTRFIVDYVRKIDDLTRVGIETEFTRTELGKSTLVIQRSVPSRDIGLKLKLASNKSIALAFQSVITDYGKFTAGWEVSDIGKSNKTRYGVQFDINL